MRKIFRQNRSGIPIAAALRDSRHASQRETQRMSRCISFRIPFAVVTVVVIAAATLMGSLSGCSAGGQGNAANAQTTANAANMPSTAAAENTAPDAQAETGLSADGMAKLASSDGVSSTDASSADVSFANDSLASDSLASDSPAGDSPAGVSSEDVTPSGRLNLFTWEGMFPQEVLDGFENEYGIRVNYVNFDFGETMLSKLEAAGGGDYDLVIVDDYIIELVVKEGLAQKLDKTKISRFGNVDPIYQGLFYDPADEYTVPYGAGVQTIVYDPSGVDIDITGYADLWDASLKDSIGIIANYRVIDGMALKVLGKSYNTDDIADIRAAGEKLVELAPNIRIIKDDQLEEDLLSGEIGAGIMYTSQVYMAVTANPELKVVFPKEGIGFGVMAGFIPSKAPNPDAAHLFLNYILEERTAAECFEWLGYYSTNKEANKYFDPALRELLILPEGFSVNMEMIENIDEAANAEHDLVWTKFKAAAGQ